MNEKPTVMPISHRIFLENAITKLQTDERIVGIAAGGSLLSNTMDEFSDIDLVLAIEPSKMDEVMHERKSIASSLGRLVGAFTGEHVGEPRLLICLYDNPVLHVDLKFVNLFDAPVRVENPVILWDRDGRFEAVLNTREAKYPEPDLQWIEDRFWVWVHYAAARIGRGELFEAVDFMSFFRVTVLGPLSLMESGSRPSGVRKIEKLAPLRVTDLQKTIAVYSRESCIEALLSAISLYISLRKSLQNDKLIINSEAEKVTIEYLQTIINEK
jgi:predicted nucleotidyltransferase